MDRNLVLAGVMLVVPLCAAAQEDVDQISYNVLNEIRLDASPSSGAVLRGIQWSGDAKSLSAALFFPGDTGSDVCLDAVSVDGLYSAQIEYSLNEGNPGLRRVPYSDKETEFLRGLGTQELALLARPGKCAPLALRAGRSDTTPIVATVARWRTDRVSGPIALLVNTLDANTVRVRLQGKTIPPETCQTPATAMLQSAYNLVCTLDPPDTVSPMLVELIPYRGAEPGRSLWVSIHLPVQD
jgi:hypothetical protein